MSPTASITIERKPPDAKAHAAIIRKAFQDKTSQPITVSLAAAVTGLPIDRCRDALMRLYGEYPGEITVDDAGELQFRFSSLSERRPSVPTPWLSRLTKPLGDWYARHTDAILAFISMPLAPPLLFALFGNLQAYLQATLMVQPSLPGWVHLLMAPLHLVALFALVFSGIGAVLTMLAFQALPLAGVTLLIGAPVMLFYPFSHHAKASQLLFFIPFAGIMAAMGVGCLRAFWQMFKDAIFGYDNTWASNSWRAAGNLLFGPPSTQDALSDERRLTALIQKEQGVLCRSDVMAQFGWTQSQAERELTRILLDYGGEIAVSPKGAVLFRFQLDDTGGETQTLPPIYERGPDMGPFWGLETNLVIVGALTTLVVVIGLWLHPKLEVLPSFDTWLHHWTSKADRKENLQFLQGFGAWPVVLFLVPNLLRGSVWGWTRLAWRRQQAWWPLLRIASEHPEGQYLPTVQTDYLTALGGTVDPLKTSADGEFWVTFPTHALEQHESRRARQALANGAGNLAKAIGAEMV